MLAPFIVSAANGGFYGALDVPQHLSAHVADGCAEGVDTIRGREIVDCLKIVLVEPPGRLNAAAFQQRVGDADGGGRLELHLHPGFIIIHQERTVNDGTNVPAVVVPVICHQFPCNVRISKGGKLFNGKSMVSVLSACVKCGTMIEVICDGECEEEALAAIVQAVENGLGE